MLWYCKIRGTTAAGFLLTAYINTIIMRVMNYLNSIVQWFYFTGKNLAYAPIRIKRQK